MESALLLHAHPAACELQPVTKQSTPLRIDCRANARNAMTESIYNCETRFPVIASQRRGNPQMQLWTATTPAGFRSDGKRHCEPKAWQSTNANRGCSYTQYPTPYTLILALLLLLSPLAHSAVWNGTANTAWYNSSANAFTITTAEQLAGLASLVNGGNNFSGDTITLGADIQLNDTASWNNWDNNTSGLKQWTPIGTSTYGRNFKGTFDGAGFAVRGLYISTSNNYQGLFGYDSAAVIKNVGVIAGYVKGGQYTGFLVGYNYSGTISNGYATGNVSGTGNYVGGLAGYSYGTISNSYATGNVSGSSYVGGLAGYSYGTISKSYYDSQTSGQNDKGKGTPKTTAQMQSQEMVDTLNFVAGIERNNAWTHNSGKYPTLSNSIAPEPDIASYFASGNGTSGNPYIITTKKHLENLAFFTNAGHSFQSEYISLGNNIALNDTAGWASWNSGTANKDNWTPIGTQATQFSGAFNGAGHTIRGLYINSSSGYQGLFGYVNSSAVIKNVGVIAGYVKGGSDVGFLAGYNGGTISNSYAAGNVVSGTSNYSYVGGLAGENRGTISNSYATGNVSGTSNYSYVGGLAGENRGTISNSYATGNVSGTGSYVGGLAGANTGTISNSYYDSQTSGQSGGYGIPKSTTEMQSAHFVELLNIYSSALGTNAWTHASGKYPTLGSTSASSLSIAGYFSGGSGASGTPYIINTKEQLENLTLLTSVAGQTFSGKYFSLGADIELNDTAGWASWNSSTANKDNWTPIGTQATQFSGAFNGAGHTIRGLYINTASNYQGLFGYVGSGATIKNIGIVAGYVEGGNYTGFLAGYNAGAISNSYAGGNVSGGSYAGGFAGQNAGTISNSYAAGTLSGSGNAGGFAGQNTGTISNSYYDKQTSGKSDESKGIPKTTAEMQSAHLVELLNIISYTLGTNAWVHSEGKYPALGNTPAQLAAINTYFENGGEGTSGNPYTITTKEHLENLAFLTSYAGYTFTGKYFSLGADIELNDTAGWASWNSGTASKDNWTPIGTQATQFSGAFNGAGHTIRGLYINSSSDYQGLFGYVNSSAVIKNVGVIAGYVKGGQYTGFLAGENLGTISNSYATGNVDGLTSAVGGFAGQNSGAISNSYAAGNVSGSGGVGGFAGQNSGAIDNSYSSGRVSGGSNAGGFAGQNTGTVSNSYYDTQTSTKSDEGKGIPKSTAEMQSARFAELLNIISYTLGTNAWIQTGKYPALGSGSAPELDIGSYFEGGEGTSGDPYTITTKEHLENLAFLTSVAGQTFSDKYLSLGADIVLNDTAGWASWNGSTANKENWTPIGASANGKKFKGTFDGKGHTIRGLYIYTSSDYQGLFGCDSGAVIKNVGVVNGYVKGGNYTGFLAGYNSSGTISNSYAIGNVSGNTNAGGLAGINFGTISNSYAAGSVSGSSYLGGLVGNNKGTISTSYYDSETSGYSDGEKGTPKTTAEMKSSDLVDLLNIVVSASFGINAWVHSDEKYPALGESTASPDSPDIDSYFTEGKGTEVYPYIITTKKQLENLAFLTNTVHSFANEYISLGADIELNDTTAQNGWRIWTSTTTGLNNWTPIGTEAKKFKGTFDGKGHTIRGLYISTTSDYQGLFGYDSGAVIKNVGVIAGYVKSRQYAGFLAGYNSSSTISNSYAIGNVSGMHYVGGLAGYNDGLVSNSSYALGNVSGNSYVGGLAGHNKGAISNSYAAGNVSGNSSFGGLAGMNEGGIITSSYYDNGSTEQGEGKTTTQMKQQATFAGWDFSDTWFINEGNDYPKLLWSIPDFQNVSASTSNLTYTGDSIKPAVTISGLTLNSNFKVKYFNNVNAGIAKAFAWGIGGTVGKKTIDFNIGKATLTATAENKTMTYGDAVPALTISYEGFVKSETNAVLTSLPTASTAATSESNAGTHLITVSGGSAANYNLSYVSGTLTISRKAILPEITANQTFAYSGTEPEIAFSGNLGGGAVSFSYYADNGDGKGARLGNAPADAGVYWAAVSIEQTTNYQAGTSFAVKYTITKIDPQITISPTAKTLTFTGTAQDLVNAGEANGGTVYYSLNNANWGTAIPQGTNAGDYTVYYKVVGDKNHNDLAGSSLSVTIAKEAILPEITANQTFAYSGTEPEIAFSGNLGGGAVSFSYYADNGGSKGTQLDNAPISAGVYLAEVSIAESKNYQAGTSLAVKYTITKIDPQITIPPTAKILIFNSANQDLVNAGEASGGTLEYSLDNENWAAAVPQGEHANTYTVYYRVIGDANHNDLAGSSLSVTIAAAGGDFEPLTNISAEYSPTLTLENIILPQDYTWDAPNTRITDVGIQSFPATYKKSDDYQEVKGNVQVNVLKASISPEIAEYQTFEYNGTAPTLEYSGNSPESGAVTFAHYADEANTIRILYAPANAGTYWAKVIIAETARYNAGTSSVVPYSITKIDPQITEPTAKTLTFTGEAQDLVNAGEASGGTFYYSFNGETWGTAIPQGTNAGDYTVYYKVVGDKNHNDLAGTSLSVAIAKEAISPAITANQTFAYSGTAPTLAFSGNSGGGVVSFAYYADNGGGERTPLGSAPANAGVYLAEVSIAESKNYLAGTSPAAQYSITKINPQITLPTAKTLTFTGEAQDLVNAGEANGGTFYYSLDNENWGTAIPQGTNAIDYSIYYKVTGDENHNDLAVSSLSVAIGKARGEFLPIAENLSATYLPTLILNDITLPSSAYAWEEPSRAVDAGDNQSFAATYADPSGNYKSANGDIIVNVAQRELSGNAVIEAIDLQIYTGTEITPTIAVRDNTKVLIESVDYTFEFSNNVDIGTATVRASGVGNYTGEIFANFEITDAQSSSSGGTPSSSSGGGTSSSSGGEPSSSSGGGTPSSSSGGGTSSSSGGTPSSSSSAEEPSSSSGGGTSSSSGGEASSSSGGGTSSSSGGETPSSSSSVDEPSSSSGAEEPSSSSGGGTSSSSGGEASSSSGGGTSSSSGGEEPSSSSSSGGTSSSSGGGTPSSSSSSGGTSSSSGGETPIIADGTFSGNFDLQVKNGMLWIATPLSGARNDVKVQIYNLKGAKVRSFSFIGGVYSVPLVDLPKGLYIVKASFGGERKVKKVMVR